jgi:hypothetical protein
MMGIPVMKDHHMLLVGSKLHSKLGSSSVAFLFVCEGSYKDAI